MTTPLATTPSATSTTSTTTAKGATASTTKPGESAMGPDAFMKLLVAQLKYQNPMAPTDGQAYMTQMATFTQVEKLDQLVKAQADAAQWQQRVSAEGLVGRSVTGSTDGMASSGTVVGVRYTDGAALLELSDGSTLAPGDVQHVQTLPSTASAAPTATPATSTTAAATAVTPAATTAAATPTSTTTLSTATPAGTPSP
ncbi:MAG: Flagellar basal-body rod modification protein FlgD [Frankiales bacterium]|nr:Flagellar basal-body rod modification protein FlgD [Frankiales bacterium]